MLPKSIIYRKPLQSMFLLKIGDQVILDDNVRDNHMARNLSKKKRLAI